MSHPPSSTTPLLEVGRIARPHGVNGEIKVAVPGDFLDVATDLEEIFVGRARKPFRVLSSRPHQNAWLLILDGVTTRNDAEALRGETVWVHEADLPELDDGEFYEHELLGLTVVTLEGETLGELCEVLVTGSNDVYVVKRPDGQELLLPAIESVVKDIDLDAGRVRVTVPDGL